MIAPYKNLTEEQKEWAFIKENIYKMSPKKVRKMPQSNIRKICYKIIKSKMFTNFITTLNILNILNFMIYHHRQPEEMESILSF